MSHLYKFSHEPKNVSEKYYESARKEIVQYYSENENVLSIYEYGSVSSPGVSDLDIMLVLRDDVNVKESLFDFSNISDEVHGLVADGNVMKMSEKNFRKINYLDNKLKVKKLFGKECLQDYPNHNDEKYLELISIIDWLPERILRLTRAINSKNINITMLLCILHSFSYSIKKIDALILNEVHQRKIKKSDSVLKTINLLRNTWHELSDPRGMLIECINDAIKLGYEYLRLFENYLKKNGKYCSLPFICSEHIDLELYPNHYLRFVDSTSCNNFELLANQTCTEKYTYVIVSNYFYPHFYFLAHQYGLLSSVMKEKIKTSSKLAANSLGQDYENNLARKLNVAEDNAQFLVKNNMKSGLIRYGFHFKY
jgi:hypothetical protein